MSPLSHPLLSVCIPTIGRQAIYNAIQSVYFSTDRPCDIQLIISDNSQNQEFGSTLAKIFEGDWQHKFNDSSTILFQEHRVPMATNWTAACLHALAPWTTILSDDDEYLPPDPLELNRDLMSLLTDNLHKSTDVICFSSLVSILGMQLYYEKCAPDISLRIPKLSSIIYKTSYLSRIEYFSERYGYGADYQSLVPAILTNSYITSNRCLSVYKINYGNSIHHNRRQVYKITTIDKVLQDRRAARLLFGYYWFTGSAMVRIFLVLIFPVRACTYFRYYPWASTFRRLPLKLNFSQLSH